ncbi:hypothetical protein W822_01630 [Advenella kashmirensis W13003]|uniref:Nudix hydrolase domain-containing protein n=1 Tax=Advenella kashmirensis W13003 TaxID=1424334 RepID=V8QZ34_9BURK|nr:NUDIX hydrolase [Advenella kashmirensis]ETF04658.1 hypothetical protein W822_01630 [Advenella kashmirensis W13003]
MRKKGQFRIKSTTQIYKNPWIEVTEDKVIRPDGTDGIFGLLDMKDGVAILPVFPDGQVILGKEYKYAQQKEMIEIIGGGIDENESINEAASRELAEEAALKAGKFHYLGPTDPFTTLVRTRDHLFIATELERLPKKPDTDDFVEPVSIPLKTAVDYVLEGKITHTTSSLLILRATLIFPQFM